MARTNKAAKSTPVFTHEGGAAYRHQTPEVELERTVATCLLWEHTFYEDGESVAWRIAGLSEQVSAAFLSQLAIKARTEYKLRHAPLWLARQMVRLHTGPLVAETIAKVVRRPDQAAELVSLYWKHNTGGPRSGKKMLPKAMKVGLAKAFQRWDAYRLAKWNRDSEVKLRDVLFMIHADPGFVVPEPGTETYGEAVRALVKDPKTKKETPRMRNQAGKGGLWKQLVDGTLPTPDTWETELSAGKDKKATWERLLTETTPWGAPKLGDIAMLMNLRNMQEAGVSKTLIKDRLRTWRPDSVALPYRFIAAAQAAPDFEDDLGVAMQASLAQAPKLAGRTLYLVDVSGSMRGALSSKSTLDRVDAAAGLAMLLREVSEDVAIYATAGDDYRRVHATAKVAPRHGFALRDAIRQAFSKLGGGGIFAYQALTAIAGVEKDPFDRVVVLTDEQDCDLNPAQTLAKSPKLGPRQYLLNVAPYKPGLDTTGGWVRISGWSERVVDYIRAAEAVPSTQ